MKKFLSEFKAFITRGNILDMAVGVIVGGAFNTIVTTLNKQILMPVINYILSFIPGMESGLYTILPNSQLLPVGSTDTAILGPDGKSYAVLNYIDWTAFIESIFNFFFIALTLFIIIKVVAYLSKKRQEFEDRIKSEIQEDEAPVEEEPILEPEPIKDPVVCLLEEIRDSLKKE